MYKMTLEMDGTSIEGKGSDTYEALATLQKPIKIVTKGILRVTDGKRTAQLNLPPGRIKRLFYPMARRLLSKQLEYLMK